MPGSLGANGGVPPSSRQSTVRHSEIAGECATAAKGGSARPRPASSRYPGAARLFHLRAEDTAQHDRDL